MKADLREKQQQEEWFRSFLTQAEVFFWGGNLLKRYRYQNFYDIDLFNPGDPLEILWRSFGEIDLFNHRCMIAKFL